MSRTPNPTSSGQDELSFEQQQEITEILELYRANPSNSNKYRFELFAKINSIVARHTQEAVEAELREVVRQCPPNKDYDRYVTKRIAELTALASTNQPKDKEKP